MRRHLAAWVTPAGRSSSRSAMTSFNIFKHLRSLLFNVTFPFKGSDSPFF
jgi:hypothetical protein